MRRRQRVHEKQQIKMKNSNNNKSKKSVNQLKELKLIKRT